MKTIQEIYNEEVINFKNQVVMMVKQINEEFGGVEPLMIALVIKEGRTTIAVLDGLAQLFAGDEELKEEAAKLMRAFNAEMKPIAIAFASEAYVATAPIGKTVIDDDGVYLDDSFRPSVNPDSKECIVITFETAKEEGIMYWEMIKMGDTTELVLMNDLELLPKDPERTSGILSGLLEENYGELAQLAKDGSTKFNMN
jgi:hypothetical protein